MAALDRSDAKFLAALIHRIRPEWDEPGILKQFDKIAEYEKPPDLATYAVGSIQYATAKKPDGTWKWDNPGGMYLDGRHWGNTVVAEKKSPDLCAEHKAPVLKCTPCKNRAIPTEVPDWRATYHQTKEQTRREAELERNTP